MDKRPRAYNFDQMIISPDKDGKMDGTVLRIAREIKTDLPIIPLTRINDFVFNPDLLNLDKYILLDYSEAYWNYDWHSSLIFGKDDISKVFEGDEWKKFNDFVSSNQPLIYFKREILQRDVTESIIPIDYPCWLPPYPVQSEDEFNARPITGMFYWGRSHEARLQLHANIWLNATKKGYSVCDNLFYFNEFMANEKGKKWVSVWIPHYGRQPIENIIAVNGLSKFSIALQGAGTKTFRATGESIVNSVVVIKEDELAWSYPFRNLYNCIKFKEFGNELKAIEFVESADRLYDIYRNGLDLADKYRIDNYTKNYLEPLINSL